MTKLTRSKGKAIACLMLICLLFAQSCSKDRFYPITPPEEHGNQLIAESTLNQSIENNPAFKLFMLDWSKARQGTLRGKHVVRIPTINNDNITGLINNGAFDTHGQSLRPESKSNVVRKPGSNINYNNQTPPEVFFIQDDNGGKLYSYLLNFVPENKNMNSKGNWKGKLYEWNLTGDTIFVQNVENNVIKESFGLKLGQDPTIDNSATTLKNNKLQSLGGLKDKKVSNFWKWIANLSADVVGWIGSLFGLSGYDIPGGGWRLQVQWSSIFGSGSSSGGTSSGGSGYTGYVSSGWPIYNAYIPGVYYQGDDIISGQAGQPSNPGNTGNPNATSLDDGFGPYPGSHGPYVNLNTLTADYVITKLGIGTQAQQSFLRNPNNVELIAALADYLDKIDTITQPDIEFGQFAVGYLMINSNVSFEELLNSEFDNETTFPTDTDLASYTELSIDNSDTRIVISLQDIVKYPKFTALVKGLYNKVATTPKIMAALVKYTGFTQTSILNDLKFDKRGPIIYITPKEQLKTWNPKTKSYSYPYGRCISDDVNKHYIFLNKEFIDLLESANGANSDALIILLATTILHEYVHWSDNNFGLSPSLAGEMGDLFEKDAFGGVLQYNKKNGKIYYRKQ